MGRVMSGQLDISPKARIRRRPVEVPKPSARPGKGRHEGSLWERKMRTLALRRPKGRARRDRSGAPMRRG